MKIQRKRHATKLTRSKKNFTDVIICDRECTPEMELYYFLVNEATGKRCGGCMENVGSKDQEQVDQKLSQRFDVCISEASLCL